MRPAVLLAALTLATAAAAADWPDERAAAERASLQQRAAVEQKLKLADNMINRSAGSRRVTASGNQEALRLLAEARASFAGSRSALDAGNLGTADELAAESLRKLGLAMRLVPEGGAEAEQSRARYVQLLGAVQTFQASQVMSAGRAGVTQPEMERVRELVRRAQGFADKADFAEASRAMEQAAGVVLDSAPRLLATGGSNPSATGAAALAAESARYQSYEDLAGIAVLRANVTPERARVLRAAVERARTLNIRAQDLGLSNRDDEAMTAAQEAIAVVREALRASGVISLQ